MIGSRSAAAVAVLAALCVCARAGEPKLIQMIENCADGPSKLGHCSEVKVYRDVVYHASEASITWFKRDPQSGELVFCGDLGSDHVRTLQALAFANGRMYRLLCKRARTRLGASLGLTWYEIDPETGDLREKGRVRCPPSRVLLAAPDGRTLYLCDGRQPKLSWFRLDRAGRPALGGTVSGAGLGGALLAVSPDGNHLYCSPRSEDRIGWVQRKPDGSLVYGGSVSLAGPHRGDAALAEGLKLGKRVWGDLTLTADGLHLYAQVAALRGELHRDLLRRDRRTGRLTFHHRVRFLTGKQDVGRALLVFNPAGDGGYYAQCGRRHATAGWFKRDPETGHLSAAGTFAGMQRRRISVITLDSRAGAVYFGSASPGGLCVVRTEGQAAEP